MSRCTVCNTPLDRELRYEEIEGGYGYCDRCEADYQASLPADAFGQTCGVCGRFLSWDDISRDVQCCSGYDPEEVIK